MTLKQNTPSGGSVSIAVVDTASAYVVTLPARTGTAALSPTVNAVNDTAAAAAGVAVGSLYRNGSIVQIRVT